MNRRNLLKSMGSMVLLVGVSQVVGAHEGNGFEINKENLVTESGPGQLVTGNFAHHHHLFEIPLNFISNPPAEGVKLHTGWAQFDNPLANFGKHFHSVLLTYDQLISISQGEVVIVEDTVKDHKYKIRLQDQ